MDKPKQYFEGTLQLRNPTQEIIDFVADAVDKRGNVWIAKTKKVKNGIDLYLSSNKFLREIGRKLKSRFGGQLITSRSLFSQDHMTSKRVYRGCVLFRHYDVKIGDVIDVRGDKIKVLSLGNDIFGKDIKTGKKVYVKFDQLR
jgi:NMD protein affecting ribosome stability and mRNA decay